MSTEHYGPNSRLLIIHSAADRAVAKVLIDRLPESRVWRVVIGPHIPKRSLAQNALLHSAISDVAAQVQWAGEYLDIDTWKLLFSAAMFGQRMLPTLDGQGFVVRTKGTSEMNRLEGSEFIESVYAFGAQRGVIWTLGDDYGNRK